MKKKLLLSIIPIFIFLFTGCATRGIPYDKMAHLIPTLKPNEGRIYFYSAVPPGGIIKVDGKKVGLIYAWSFSFIDIPIGEHEITGHNCLVCSIGKMSITLSPGDVRYVELLSSGLSVKLILVDPDEGKSSVSRCWYIGSDLTQ